MYFLYSIIPNNGRKLAHVLILNIDGKSDFDSPPTQIWPWKVEVKVT